MINRVPFLDLRISDDEKSVLLNAIDEVFTHGKIVLGPEVEECENKIAQYCGKKYAVGVSSGSDALMLGMKALGIGADDEVITTSLSWVATANAIAALGATPVFSDVNNDLNLSPDSVERLITNKTKAILVVHYTGLIADMVRLREIADKHKLLIIEDAAQAFGAKQNGKTAGSFGDVACFSMNPMKVFAACGETGVVLTDDENIYQSLQSLRYNGTINKEECVRVSLNYRMDTIQAAILLARLKTLDDLIDKRRTNARFYYQHLAKFDNLELPTFSDNDEHVFYTFMLRCKNRDKIMAQLQEHGIETKIQHKCLMPYQPAFSHYPRDILSNAEVLVNEILCIPVHEKMSSEELEYVVETIEKLTQ